MLPDGTKVVVVLGGGTAGPPISGEFCDLPNWHTSSVAPGSDSGGDSGVLKDKHGVLPPGDVRRFLVAHAKDKAQRDLRELFNFRFPGDDPLYPNMVVGNMLASACERWVGRVEGIRRFSRLLNIRGSVHYASKQDAHLVAELSDGDILRGEKAIDTREPADSRSIHRVWLEPAVGVNTDVLKDVERADLIVLSPGDFYTSLIAILLVELLAGSLNRSRAPIVWVASLMSKPAETRGYSVGKFVDELYEYGLTRVNAVVCNNAPLPRRLLKHYRARHSLPVGCTKQDRTHLEKLNIQLIECDVLDKEATKGERGLIRHDPKKLVSVLAGLA